MNLNMEHAQPNIDLVLTYLAERVRRHEYAPDTVKNNRSILLRFVDWVDKPVADVVEEDVEHWLEALEHLAPATRRDRFSVVGTFFRWALRRGHVERDPTMFVVAPRQPRTVPRALPAEAVAATLAACPDIRARLIVLLMVQEGLRCGEVSRLQVGDVDRASRYMRVVGKGGHERVIWITDELLATLDAYLDELPASAGPLIRNKLWPGRGLRPDTISGIVSDWMSDAGIKRRARDGVSPHAFRHTCATDMLRSGAHIRDVQFALGHAHLSTTEVYLPYLVRGLDEAMGGRWYGRQVPPATSDGAKRGALIPTESSSAQTRRSPRLQTGRKRELG